MRSNASATRISRRSPLALTAVAVALAVVGVMLAIPARAVSPAIEEPAGGFWFRCQTQPLTWSLYIAPGTRLSAAKERRLITRSLSQVTAASNGAYRFEYVPTTGTPVVVWSDKWPIEWQMLTPSYVSTPGVDVLFMVTGKGQPTLAGSDGSFPFTPGGEYRSKRTKGAYSSELATTLIGYTVRAQGYLLAPTMERSSVRERQEAYLWAAANAAGSSTTRLTAALTGPVKAEIAELAQASCAAVATYPDAEPGDY